ncbi:hypothetical protein B0T26DRAFT_757749 [Lasiosphaeria miniovina]|uniref:Uncharacterized protein n=1 Tax=Lasiosphaeria miniovina TaxID=1954250 RepID=A0AA39ZQV3_9PEZI|nr:uncharacterized protein B0T26DRAFT_757749 [Lasiosphaeria miniovina]KAK0701760.1 hypothetical protein B0T26DRAFT_757749 [Lasiosphaeria miniovina]
MGSQSEPICGSDQSNSLTPALACRELIETLESHRAMLEPGSRELEKHAAKQANNLRGTQAKKAGLETAQREKSSHPAYLDLKYLERIPQDRIQGQTAFSQAKSYFAVRPTFNVSVTTDTPIRSWERQQSEGVSWNPVPATAEIVLFGWRKEIQAAEIAQLRASLKELEGDIVSANAAVKTYSDAGHLMLKVCQGDLGKVKTCTAVAPGAVASAKAQAYLDAGSLSGYEAAFLALESKIDPASPPPASLLISDDLSRQPVDLPPLLASAMDACETDVRSAE